MSKYIDAEKLKAEIQRYKQGAAIARFDNAGENADYFQGKVDLCNDLTHIITSLQQEQPMPDSTKLIELWHEDKEMLKEKDFRDDPWRLAYNAFLCGFGRGIAVKKQEQPEVDLEKEMTAYIERHFHIRYDETLEVGNDPLTTADFEKIARHFYEIGFNAKNK